MINSQEIPVFFYFGNFISQGGDVTCTIFSLRRLKFVIKLWDRKLKYSLYSLFTTYNLQSLCRTNSVFFRICVSHMFRATDYVNVFKQHSCCHFYESLLTDYAFRQYTLILQVATCSKCQLCSGWKCSAANARASAILERLKCNKRQKYLINNSLSLWLRLCTIFFFIYYLQRQSSFSVRNAGNDGNFRTIC